MPDTNARTVMTIRGMVIDIRSDECLYVTIGDKTYYIDDSTGEAIMEWWPVTGREQDRTTCPECEGRISEAGRCWNCSPEEGA